MTQREKQCPKCGHSLPAGFDASAACPACGVFFFKLSPVTQAASSPNQEGEDGDELPYEYQESRLAALFQPLQKLDETSFYGRCVALLGIMVWSWFLIRYDYRIAEINYSFMHRILLPIHEAGHVIFSILGNFMMTLGGSLFQILLPLGIGIAFIVKQRDNFGAAICFWWASVSLVDVSPYIYDALHPQIVLLGGSVGDEAGIHDWINLLTTLGRLKSAQTYGALAHFIGSALMIAGLLWALIILLRQRNRLGDTAD